MCRVCVVYVFVQFVSYIAYMYVYVYSYVRIHIVCTSTCMFTHFELCVCVRVQGGEDPQDAVS